MQKTKQTRTRLLVIGITTAAIIAAATTTSLSAATPAFAKRNCNEGFTVCSGGSGCTFAGCTVPGSRPSDIPGGGGGRETADSEGATFNLGGGGQIQTLGGQTLVGGGGSHVSCDTTDSCNPIVGGSGQHVKGPNN